MDPDTSGDPRLGARIVALRRGAGARVHSLVHLARKRGRPRVPSATPRAAVEVPEVASVPARPLVAPGLRPPPSAFPEQSGGGARWREALDRDLSIFTSLKCKRNFVASRDAPPVLHDHDRM